MTVELLPPPKPGTGERWFVLVVRPQKERLAAGYLATVGIGHSFRTEIVHRLNHRGKTVPVRVPLLRGYMPFICPPGTNVFDLRDQACVCPFIKGLLVGKADQVPLQLRDDWEDWLRTPPEPREPTAVDYTPGQQVKLTAFPFVGMLATCDRITTDADGNPFEVEVSMPGPVRRIVLPAHAARRAA